MLHHTLHYDYLTLNLTGHQAEAQPWFPLLDLSGPHEPNKLLFFISHSALAFCFLNQQKAAKDRKHGQDPPKGFGPFRDCSLSQPSLPTLS